MSHLFRPFSVPGEAPLLRIVRGDGSYVEDTSGRRYLDAASGLWNTAFGLGHAYLLEKMQAQLQVLAYSSLFDNTHTMAERLAARLVGLSGEMARAAYLSTTGSSAVEAALTIAHIYHQARADRERLCILAFRDGYHGAGSLARSVSGLMQQEIREFGFLPSDVSFLPSMRSESESLDALSSLLHKDRNRFACLIMEPIPGSGGVFVPSRAYCQEVSSLCHDNGVLLIADEVASGIGRCGAFLASEVLGLEPDIVALSKGLTAGYFPLGATLFSETVAATLRNFGRPLPMGSTQDGNPVGCAAALAVLDLMEDGSRLQRVRERGSEIRKELESMIGSGPVCAVRGLGYMIGIELQPRTGSIHALASVVRDQCKDEGLLIYPSDTGISLFLPLTLSDDESNDLLDILREVLTR